MMDKDLFVSLPHMQRGIEISVCIDFFFFGFALRTCLTSIDCCMLVT
jgi:hypothetical protein